MKKELLNLIICAIFGMAIGLFMHFVYNFEMNSIQYWGLLIIYIIGNLLGAILCTNNKK